MSAKSEANMRRFLAVMACLLAAGCFSRPAIDGPVLAGDDLDVHEAVFRFRLQKQPADIVAYLSVDGKDPPADLLNRLRKDWPNLKPVSETPKGKGFSIHAEGLKWTGRGTAVLKAGHWIPTKYAGEGYTADHHLVRDGGRWFVEKVTNETMS
jgi:hypothetical protein